MSDQLYFVLIHGSWHPGRAWRHVAAALQQLGHCSDSVTLPGRPGGDGEVSMNGYTAAVTDFVKSSGRENVVLVGHSAGGTIACRAAAQLVDSVRRLVLVTPLLADDGRALTDAVPPDYGALFVQMAAASRDNSILPPWPVWREAFIGDADYATAKEAYAELCAEPFGPLSAPVAMPSLYEAQIPVSYVHCTEDNVFPVGEWGLFPRMYQKVAPSRLVTAAGSHEMMYSAPRALAEALVRAGRD